MKKFIFLIPAGIILIFALIIISQPAHFMISRSLTILTQPEDIFPHVNRLRAWKAWSPWAKLDPEAKETFEGPSSGTGASMTWSGNNQVGEGKMTVVESMENAFIRFRLDFMKPFKSMAISEFTFVPKEDGTLVTWTMYGHNNFIGKAISLFMDCDKMMGSQFEEGLSALNSVVSA